MDSRFPGMHDLLCRCGQAGCHPPPIDDPCVAIPAGLVPPTPAPACEAAGALETSSPHPSVIPRYAGPSARPRGRAPDHSLRREVRAGWSRRWPAYEPCQGSGASIVLCVRPCVAAQELHPGARAGSSKPAPAGAQGLTPHRRPGPLRISPADRRNPAGRRDPAAAEWRHKPPAPRRSVGSHGRCTRARAIKWRRPSRFGRVRYEVGADLAAAGMLHWQNGGIGPGASKRQGRARMAGDAP